jgi:hypothetical protein
MLSHYRAIPETIAQNKRRAEGRLSMPVLALGAEHAPKDRPLVTMRAVGSDVRGGVLLGCRAVKKLEITVPAAVTPNYMERLGTDGRFREASSQRHGMLTPRWKGQSSEIPTSPGSLTGAEAGYRPETPRPLPPPGEHRLPPRTPVLTTAGA